MRRILLCICIISGNLSSAQQSGYTFINYTTANGLADNLVQSILQDTRGFMWFGTQEGLSRYDGSGFKNFFYKKK